VDIACQGEVLARLKVNDSIEESSRAYYVGAQPSAEEQVRFLAMIEKLLDEGQFVATYKYALLLSLVELAIEHGNDSGAPMRVPVISIAEKFIELYWRQVLPYSGMDSTTDGRLHQNKGAQAKAITTLSAAREQLATLTQLRASRRWESLRSTIAALICKMPLGKLQTIGGDKLEFLYRIDEESKSIDLLPGVVFNFRRYAQIIRRLVQSDWLEFVQNLPANRAVLGQAATLASFMFGDERQSLRKMRGPLEEIQRGRCFYCNRSIRKEGHVDHFVPWSRYPRDLIHNFVLTHASCNSAKSDFLAAEEHLDRWCERNQRFSRELVCASEQAGILIDHAASMCATRWSYGHAEDLGARVWVRNKEFNALSGSWRNILAA
jgi:hypothetical protein